jgi:hypothetical protein
MPDAHWAVDLAITDGPRVRSDGNLTVDGYDRITVTVPKADGGPKTVNVQVQPGGAGAVTLLGVNASTYLVGGAVPLTFKVDNKPAAGVALDAPLFLIGAGALSLLPGPANAIALINSSTTDVVVDIVVGRKAIA